MDELWYSEVTSIPCDSPAHILCRSGKRRPTTPPPLLRPSLHLAGWPDHHVLEQQAQVDVGVVAESDGSFSLGAQRAVGRLQSGEVGRVAHRFCGVTKGGAPVMVQGLGE